MSLIDRRAQVIEDISYSTSVNNYAYHLSKYLTDPSSIESALRYHYGEGVKLPPRQTILDMMARNQAPKRHRLDLDLVLAGDNDDGEPWRCPPAPGFIAETQPRDRRLSPKALKRQADIVLPEKPERHKLSIQEPLGRQIIQATADWFGISYGELIGTSRKPLHVGARGVAVRLLRDQTLECGRLRYSFPVIGRLLHRDHSTIIHAYDSFADRAKRHPALTEALVELREVFNGKA